MKSFNWQDFLRGHALFASLHDSEIAHLLQDEISHERLCQQDEIILREGEVGDSLFVIRSGAVHVMLKGVDGPATSLAVMHAGEIFGEMAVLEQKPRSATVFAKENCLLLEIAGTDIRKLLELHPDMQVKMYTIVRDRMQHWFHRLNSGESRSN